MRIVEIDISIYTEDIQVYDEEHGYELEEPPILLPEPTLKDNGAVILPILESKSDGESCIDSSGS